MAPDEKDRALVTRIPHGMDIDGHRLSFVVETPWVEGRRWTMPAQLAQADQHRETVRAVLADMRQPVGR